MVLSMSDPLKTCCRLISLVTLNAISSQVLADGLTRCDLQDGPTINQSGRDHVPASHSPCLENEKAPTTPVIYGLNSIGSLASADLQQSLANRLQVRTASLGSTLFRLIWKERTTPLGRRICALRASGRRTSDNVCSGWQTPRARGDAGGQRWRQNGQRSRAFKNMNLEDFARIHCLQRGLTVEEVQAVSLSPTFVRRLMGYPAEWDSCGATAMQSCLKSRRRS